MAREESLLHLLLQGQVLEDPSLPPAGQPLPLLRVLHRHRPRKDLSHRVEGIVLGSVLDDDVLLLLPVCLAVSLHVPGLRAELQGKAEELARVGKLQDERPSLVKVIARTGEAPYHVLVRVDVGQGPQQKGDCREGPAQAEIREVLSHEVDVERARPGPRGLLDYPSGVVQHGSARVQAGHGVTLLRQGQAVPPGAAPEVEHTSGPRAPPLVPPLHDPRDEVTLRLVVPPSEDLVVQVRQVVQAPGLRGARRRAG